VSVTWHVSKMSTKPLLIIIRIIMSFLESDFGIRKKTRFQFAIFFAAGFSDAVVWLTTRASGL